VSRFWRRPPSLVWSHLLFGRPLRLLEGADVMSVV